MAQTRMLIGEVSINSGQLLIADPQSVDEKWGDDTYAAVCSATGSDRRGGEVVDGFAINAYWGDGTYMVYSVMDERGRPLKVEIEIAPALVLQDYDYDVEDWLPESDQ